MARYVRVLTRVWQDERFVALGEDARLLFLYLLTSPHQNILGMYVLPAGYACADLGWSDLGRFSAAMDALEPKMARYDPQTRVVWVRNFLRHNPLANESQVKAAVAQVEELPRTPLLRELADYLEAMPRPADSKVPLDELVAKCREWAEPCPVRSELEEPPQGTSAPEAPCGHGAGTVPPPWNEGVEGVPPPGPDAVADAPSEGPAPASGGVGIAPSRRREGQEEERPLEPETLAAQGNGTVEPPCPHGAATVPPPCGHTVTVTVTGSVTGSAESLGRNSHSSDEAPYRVDTLAPSQPSCAPEGAHVCEAPGNGDPGESGEGEPEAGGEPAKDGARERGGGRKRKRPPAGGYTAEFEEFWQAYPRRVEKAAAFACWRTRVREGHTPAELIAAARHYAEYCRRRGTEEEFIKHPKTFLGPKKPFQDWLRPRADPGAAGHVPRSWHTLRRYLESLGEDGAGEQGRDGETAGVPGSVLSGVGPPV